MADVLAVYSASPNNSALLQCELLSGVVQYVVQKPVGIVACEAVPFKRVLHPLSVILSQDCDLERDFTARQTTSTPDPKKTLENTLLCVAQKVSEIRNPTEFDSKMWRRLTENREERFQYLRNVPIAADARGIGIEEIVIDFRRNFTVPTEYLYSQLGLEVQRRTVLRSPYLEHLSQRYARYLSRIALPVGHNEAQPNVV